MKRHIREEIDSSTADTNPYRQIIGSVMHVAVYTCPDIAFVASKLAQYIADTFAAHRHAAKHSSNEPSTSVSRTQDQEFGI
jgi:hypothetical protein